MGSLLLRSFFLAALIRAELTHKTGQSLASRVTPPPAPSGRIKIAHMVRISSLFDVWPTWSDPSNLSDLTSLSTFDNFLDPDGVPPPHQTPSLADSAAGTSNLGVVSTYGNSRNWRILPGSADSRRQLGSCRFPVSDPGRP